jgi:hypothetical protein
MTSLKTLLCTAALCAVGASNAAFAGNNLCGTPAAQCSSPGTCITYGWSSNSAPNPQNLGKVTYTQCTTDCTEDTVILYTNVTDAQYDASIASVKSACNDQSGSLGHIAHTN